MLKNRAMKFFNLTNQILKDQKSVNGMEQLKSEFKNIKNSIL
jgi:hypothetical protein